MLSCKFCEIFKDTIFAEHLRASASALTLFSHFTKLDTVLCYNAGRKNLKLFDIYQIFLWPKLKWGVLISNKKRFLKVAVEFENDLRLSVFRSSLSEVFMGKGVLKICSKFTGEHPCQSTISIKLRISGKSQNWAKYFPRSSFSSQNENFINASKKLLTSRYWTFLTLRYLIWNLNQWFSFKKRF